MPPKALPALLLFLVAGCGGSPPPEVYNDHLFDAIQAAIAKRDDYSLGQYANRARACRESGQLSDEQNRELEAIMQKGRGGDWKGAQSDVDAFCRQQRSPRGNSDAH
jgi:hypothetical protein